MKYRLFIHIYILYIGTLNKTQLIIDLSHVKLFFQIIFLATYSFIVYKGNNLIFIAIEHL